MKTISKKINLTGFTIIELIIVVSVISILAAMVVVDLNKTRVAARDSQRRASVQGYANAASLYFNTWKSYVIQDWSANGGKGCDYTNGYDYPNGYGTQTFSGDIYNYSNLPACVGYFGQGWGGITVGGDVTYVPSGGNTTSHYYSSTSIAEALVHDGLLASVQTDPNDPNAILSNKPGALGTTNYGTFLYTVCNKNGGIPNSVSSASNFAVLSELESPSSSEILNAESMCGNNPGVGMGGIISNLSPHP